MPLNLTVIHTVGEFYSPHFMPEGREAADREAWAHVERVLKEKPRGQREA